MKITNMSYIDKDNLKQNKKHTNNIYQTNTNMENFVIIHAKKDGKVIFATNTTIESAYEMKNYITDMYVNETGGFTIIIEISLT